MAPHPEFDTTPIEFSIDNVHYRMPRNYIVSMENWRGGPQGMVSIRINFYDLKPLSPEMTWCYILPRGATERPQGCYIIQVNISPSGSLTPDQAFENSRGLFRSQVPITTPFGLEKYEVGRDSVMSEHYRLRRDGQTFFFHCAVGPAGEEGTCYPAIDTLPNGNGINFFFPGRLLEGAVMFDERIRDLIENFEISSVKGR